MKTENLPYGFTEHAKQAVKERKIKPEWIRSVLSTPDRIEPDKEDEALEHALAEIPEFGNRVLRVIYNKHEKPVTIITVYFDRTMRGEL